MLLCFSTYTGIIHVTRLYSCTYVRRYSGVVGTVVGTVVGR